MSSVFWLTPVHSHRWTGFASYSECFEGVEFATEPWGPGGCFGIMRLAMLGLGIVDAETQRSQSQFRRRVVSDRVYVHRGPTVAASSRAGRQRWLTAGVNACWRPSASRLQSLEIKVRENWAFKLLVATM